MFLIFQIPEEVPKPHNNPPLDPGSATEMVLYVAIPVLFIILYFLWKRGRRNRR
ncbi:adenylosuccinate synthetase [Robertkochia flava]|uniref:adenylosuccinate synthetase n=1 Tax=Robertkochia flava TaxID=3447986 RepID=UPI001CCF36AE|nr:adenylosuccinate synthetase [Robertkochia marina]